MRERAPSADCDLGRGVVDPDDCRPEQRRDSERAQLPLAARRERRRERRQHAVGRLDEQNARPAGVHRPVLPVQDVLAELGDLPCHLDAGRPRADDDEREPLRAESSRPVPPPRPRTPQDAVAQVQCACERLQLGRVGGPFVVAEVRVARTAGNDERVVVEGQLCRRSAGPSPTRAARPGRSRRLRRARRGHSAGAAGSGAAALPLRPTKATRLRPGRRAAGRGRSSAGRRASPRPPRAGGRGRRAVPQSHLRRRRPFCTRRSVAPSSCKRCRFTSRPPA